MRRLPRLPFEPLHALADIAPDAPPRELAALFGVQTHHVYRWRADGLTLHAAEDACDRLGVHPCEVWGDDWIKAALDGTVRTIAPHPPSHCGDCGKPLPAYAGRGRRPEHCNRACQVRASTKKRRGAVA